MDSILQQSKHLTLLQNPKGMFKILDEHGELIYTSWYLQKAMQRFTQLKAEVNDA